MQHSDDRHAPRLRGRGVLAGAPARRRDACGERCCGSPRERERARQRGVTGPRAVHERVDAAIGGDRLELRSDQVLERCASLAPDERRLHGLLDAREQALGEAVDERAPVADVREEGRLGDAGRSRDLFERNLRPGASDRAFCGVEQPFAVGARRPAATRDGRAPGTPATRPVATDPGSGGGHAADFILAVSFWASEAPR